MEFGKVWFGEGGNIARLYVVQSRSKKKPVRVGTVVRGQDGGAVVSLSWAWRCKDPEKTFTTVKVVSARPFGVSADYFRIIYRFITGQFSPCCGTAEMESWRENCTRRECSRSSDRRLYIRAGRNDLVSPSLACGR